MDAIQKVRSVLSSSKTPRLGLRAKLIRVYALQLLLISIAASVGVFITYLIVQDVLTRQALNGEAEHYWSLFDENPDQPLPNTNNLVGFLAKPGDLSTVPAYLHDLEPSFGPVSGLKPESLAHVSEHNGHHLYLVFAEAQVSDLVFYFGLAPLAAVLLTVYFLLFATYRLSQRAISPVLALARSLEKFDFETEHELSIPNLTGDEDAETRTMVRSLEHFVARIERFVERERNFTRDAGHELRTPIAVLKGSLDLLENQPTRSPVEEKTLARMRRVLDETETLLETLLLLAREQDAASVAPRTNVSHVVAEQVEQLSALAAEQGNRLVYDSLEDCWILAQDRVVAIIVGNLLRNALSYTTEGTVTVTVKDLAVRIEDTGIGMSESDIEQAFSAFYRSDLARASGRGHGLGLAIVKRLTDQFGWTVALDSEVGRGSTLTVRFASAHR